MRSRSDRDADARPIARERARPSARPCSWCTPASASASSRGGRGRPEAAAKAAAPRARPRQALRRRPPSRRSTRCSGAAGGLQRERPFKSRGTNVRFGAAVYGSFLVASVVGVAFEAGQDARAMTTTAFASALVFWLAHWWSEVIGEQISAGEDSGVATFSSSPVASGRWSKRPSFPRFPRPRLGRRVVAERAPSFARCGRPPDHRVGTGRRPSRRMVWLRAGLFAAVAERSASFLLLEKLVH